MRRLLSILKRTRGFTLIEVAIVVAVVATIAATVTPMVVDKVETGRITKARADVQHLGTAIASFLQDTSEFPTRKGTQKNFFEVLRSSEDTSLDPGFASGLSALWGLDTAKVDVINNHLLLDKPGGVANGYKDAKRAWIGPYMGSIGTDPWGRNYLIVAKGFYDKGTTSSPIFAWIISAGPNETVETEIRSEVLNNKPADGLSTKGDDVGFLLFTAL